MRNRGGSWDQPCCRDFQHVRTATRCIHLHPHEGFSADFQLSTRCNHLHPHEGFSALNQQGTCSATRCKHFHPHEGFSALNQHGTCCARPSSQATTARDRRPCLSGRMARRYESSCKFPSMPTRSHRWIEAPREQTGYLHFEVKSIERVLDPKHRTVASNSAKVRPPLLVRSRRIQRIRQR